MESQLVVAVCHPISFSFSPTLPHYVFLPAFPSLPQHSQQHSLPSLHTTRFLHILPRLHPVFPEQLANHVVFYCFIVEESGVNDNVENKFPGATVTYGSAASGAGDNREIPDEEGGGINPQTKRYFFTCTDPRTLLASLDRRLTRHTIRQTKAKDFEGVGGPEDKLAADEVNRGGDEDLLGNVRQGGETKRP